MNEKYFSSEYIARTYDQMAESYNDNRHLFNNASQLEELGKLVEKGDSVLDVGCGSGIPAGKYFVGHGCELTGFDLSEKMIELARKNVPAGDFFKADILTVDLPAETYDMVISFYCVFHIEKVHQEDVFRKFYRTVKTGGYSYFTLAGDKYTGRREFQGTMRFGDHLLPYAHFSEEQYREMLTGVGFDILSMKDLTIGGETMLWVLARK